MRQVSLSPESIKIGDKVVIWGEKRRPRRSRPLTPEQKKELKAFALLVGPGRFPASRGEDAPKYFSGRIVSLNPPQIRLDDKKTVLRLLPTAQMPIARLERIKPDELKLNRGGMFVLARGAGDEFVASTVILNAAPWVGYGQ
jgi:hypothetical protein